MDGSLSIGTQPDPGEACTLMEACAAAVIHGEGLLLLVILFQSFPPLFRELLGPFYGALPAEPQFLIATSRHWLIFVLCSTFLLAADVRVYRWLFSKKGRAAPGVWSAAVSTALTIAIISYGWLRLRSLLWIASYNAAR
jgi:hypothetical protein